MQPVSSSATEEDFKSAVIFKEIAKRLDEVVYNFLSMNPQYYKYHFAGRDFGKRCNDFHSVTNY